jgi:hypothetical protein
MIASLALAAFTLLGTLYWNDNSSNETGFVIEQSIGGAAYVELTRVGIGVTSYEVKITDQRKWCWRVRALYDTGQTAPTNIRCIRDWSVRVQ